jgi:hypothetical protein
LPIETRPGEERGLTNILFDTGTLFHLYIGRWTGNKKMTERDLLIEEVDKSAFYLGHKKLLPKKAQEQLQWIEGQSRSYLAARSIPFIFGNARFVSYHVLRDVIARLQQFKQDWNAAVADLTANYPQFKEEQLALLDRETHSIAEKELSKAAPYAYNAKREEMTAWEEERRKLNRSLYPTVDELSGRFAFEWRMFKMSPLEGMERMNTLEAEALLEEQQRLKADMSQWVRQASVVMHKELGEAAANAKRLLEENGKLNPRSLRPLFDAFETFNAINFAGPSQFKDTIDSIRARYLQRSGGGETDWELTASTVNNSTEEMRSLLTTISSLAVQETAQAAGIRSVRAGDFGRIVDLSD